MLWPTVEEFLRDREIEKLGICGKGVAYIYETDYEELSRRQFAISGEYVEVSRSTTKMMFTISSTTRPDIETRVINHAYDGYSDSSYAHQAIHY